MTVTVTTDWETLKQTIVDWLKTYGAIAIAPSTITVVWGRQPVPRPSRPYIMVLFVSRGQQLGVDEQRASYNATSELIERVTAGPRVIALQIEAYSEPGNDAADVEAAEILEGALYALASEPVKAAFRAAMIGVLDYTAPRNTDEQLGERWERRAMCEVTLAYSGETFDDGGGGSGQWIETVEEPTEGNGNADYGA